MKIHDFDPKHGMAFQGDLVIFAVPSNSFTCSNPFANQGQFLTLLEGEASGHHHCIDLLSPAQLSELLDSELKPTAKLYQDNSAAQQIVEDSSLCIGFLEIIGSPFLLVHQKLGQPTEEHDAIRLPAGCYYVGRQRQFDAGQAIFVAD